MKASSWRSLDARTFRRGMPPNCAMSRSVEAKDILIAEVKVNTSEVPSCLHARVVGHILSKSLIKPRWSLEGSFAESPNQSTLAAAKVPIAAMPLRQPYGRTLGPDLLQCLMFCGALAATSRSSVSEAAAAIRLSTWQPRCNAIGCCSHCQPAWLALLASREPPPAPPLVLEVAVNAADLFCFS